MKYDGGKARRHIVFVVWETRLVTLLGHGLGLNDLNLRRREQPLQVVLLRGRVQKLVREVVLLYQRDRFRVAVNALQDGAVLVEALYSKGSDARMSECHRGGGWMCGSQTWLHVPC